ncbi:hypothetical protein BDZ45DRAFT_806267 [Acephala macrosclerotiorum]|nr:hypothetical protein BDZ45DRAFT_806267 [Acephala macrosclerotiorum]
MATFDMALYSNADQDFDLMKHDQLVEAANSLRTAYHDCLAEKERQHEELARALRANSFPLSTASIELQPTWIRAELDSPGDTTFSCFGEKSKYPDVLVYDCNGSSLETRSRESLKEEQGVIYSRIPSQRTNAVHLFVECSATVANGSPRKFRISTNDRVPTGFVPHCTIHFKRLRWGTRWKLLTGQIKWLFILRNKDTRADAKTMVVREKRVLLQHG